MRTRRRAVGSAGSAVTPGGWVTIAGGSALLGSGLALHWPGFELIGGGLLTLVLLALANVLRPSRVRIERAIQPPRVPKGTPAIAVLTFENAGRRAVGTTVAAQPFGSDRVRTVIPRLRRGQRGLRTYRLPTRQRGIFDVGPVEVVRRDPFDLVRRTRRYGAIERIWVQPRILELQPLPTGRTQHLEGPSSDTSPEGTVTFHRLREYVAGDDLRLVHWRSSARAGRLVVRHNVDTSQPYTVVLLDLRASRYDTEAFEAAVDVAASAVVAASGGKSPVELRLSDGTVAGGARATDVTPLLDLLTGVAAAGTGDLRTPLLQLRRVRGTSLTVVTGDIDPTDLPYLAALRRRFERLVLVSVDAAAAPARLPGDHRSRYGGRADSRPAGTPSVPGVRIIVAADADGAQLAWNRLAAGGTAPAPGRAVVAG